MIHNGRKIHNPRVVESIWRFESGDILYELAKKKQAKQREIRENSKEELDDQIVRKNTQMHSRAEMDLVDELRIKGKELAGKYIEFVIAELNIRKKAIKVNKYQQINVSFEKIQQLMEEGLPFFKKLRSLTESPEIISSNKKNFSTFESMFVSLIELDARFALYAPKASLNKVGMEFKFDAMAEEYKSKVYELKAILEENPELDYVCSTECEEKSKNEKVQELIDRINEEKFKAKFEMVKSTENLCLNCYHFICEYLGLNVDKKKELNHEEIERALNVSGRSLKALAKSSSNKMLDEVASWDEFDPYTELFNKLIDINIKFVFFAPIKSLARLDIDFSGLTNEEKSEILKVLIDNGLWRDKEYYEKYKECFENVNLNEKTI